MRVLVLTHNYPRFPADPAGGFVARLARAAGAAGARVQVVVPHSAGTQLREDDGPVAVTRFRYAPEALERIGFRGDVRRSAFAPAALAAAPGFLCAFRKAAAAAMADFRPEIVHAHWWLPAGFFAVRAAGRTPVVITCHGSDARLLGQGAVLRRLGGRVLAKASVVTTVSEAMAKEIRRRLPDLATRLEVLPLPVEVDRFASAAAVVRTGPPLVLFAGNLIGSKGVDLLLTAFAELRRRNIPCRLKLLGEGPAEGELRALARRLGLDQAVIWSPFVPMDRMPAEYAAAAIVVLPSRGAQGEGMPLSLVEALVAGCAVVAAPAGGVPEIIEDGVSGWLMRDGDSDHLAQCLASALGAPAERARRTAEGARRVLTRFAPAPAAAAFQALYADLVRRAEGDRAHVA